MKKFRTIRFIRPWQRVGVFVFWLAASIVAHAALGYSPTQRWASAGSLVLAVGFVAFVQRHRSLR